MTDRTNINNLPQTENTNSNIYSPLEVHPPPFTYNNNIFPQTQENHRLPSRDIAINPNDYTNDTQIKANYIPSSNKKVKDYIKNYRQDEYLHSRNHKLKKKEKLSFIQDFLLLVAIMFIFQMPIINSFIHKYCLCLGIYNIDGQLNNKGMLFKSSFMSIIYMMIQSSHTFLFKCFQYI